MLQVRGLLLLALFATAAGAAVAAAQTATNTTITIYLPNVSVTVRPAWQVIAFYVNQSHVEVLASCMSLAECPSLVLTVTNSTGTCYSTNVTANPGQSVRLLVRCPGGVRVIYEYDDVRGVVTAKPRRTLPPLASYIITAALIGLVVSLALRSDPKLIPVGILLGSIIVAAATLTGYAGPSGAIVASLGVIVAVILFWLSRE